MPIFDREVDRVGCYRFCVASKSAEKMLLLEVEKARSP